MLTEWQHDRVIADLEQALSLTDVECWPRGSSEVSRLCSDDLAEVIYWSVYYGRVMYRPGFGPPEESLELDMVVLARAWSGEYVAVVARTGPEGWSDSSVEVTICDHLQDAVEGGLDDRARESLGLAGWHR